MASISAAFGGLVGLSEPSARFFLAMMSAYPLSFLYRAAFAKQGSAVQNLYFTVSGVLVIYYVFGFALWHSVVDILLVYSVLWWCGGTLLSVQLTWIIAMGHLLIGYGYAMYTNKIHAIYWTIPHCVLTLKLIGLSYNLYDAKKDPEKLSTEFKALSIAKLPSFIDVTGFCYFYGSALVGPQTPFSRHLKFTEGRLFDWDKTPSSIPPGLQRLSLGILFAALYALLQKYFPLSLLLDDSYSEYSFPTKLLLLYLCAKVAMWKYVNVWMVAEGACILTGISYQEQEGCVVSWHGLDNIHIINFETCITLQGVVESFNMNTNKWVSWYVFKRLKFLGNMTLSWAVTMAFVCVWHGWWPGYFLCFSLEMLGIAAERALASFVRGLFGQPLAEMGVASRLPLSCGAFLLKNVIIIYPQVIFVFLRWSDCYKFMSSVYFYAHILIISWIALYYLFLSRLFRNKTRKTE